MRWLAIALVLGLVSTADAQVFKPKGKKAEVSEKKSEPKAAKKASKSTKKKGGSKSKKSAARSDDSADEASSKSEDKDFVKITDDDDIE